jgi:hypothetical protein
VLRADLLVLLDHLGQVHLQGLLAPLNQHHQAVLEIHQFLVILEGPEVLLVQFLLQDLLDQEDHFLREIRADQSDLSVQLIQHFRSVPALQPLHYLLSVLQHQMVLYLLQVLEVLIDQENLHYLRVLDFLVIH